MSGERNLRDQGPEDVALREAVDLVAELETVQDFLDVGGIAVQVCLEVSA